MKFAIADKRHGYSNSTRLYPLCHKRITTHPDIVLESAHIQVNLYEDKTVESEIGFLQGLDAPCPSRSG